MHAISRKPFADAIKKFPNNAAAIESTYSVLKRGDFKKPQQLQAVFSSLDNFKYKDKWWSIDIGSNNLRMLPFIEFRHNRIYVKHIVTQSEYEARCKKYRK